MPGRGREALLSLIRRLGFGQLDSINVIERAHHLTLRTRMAGYHPADLFITVVDNKTGFIEAFWDKRPRIAGGWVPMRQLPNVPLDKNSPEYQQRKKLYEDLGANRHRPA